MNEGATKSKLTPTGPRLECKPVSPFNSMDHVAVRAAFQAAAHCELQQAWQDAPSSNFAPAVVRVGWRHNVLWVYAELTDADIFTQASGLNQRLWELGDSFEIFLRPEAQQEYFELQVSPNNQHLQLRYVNTAALNRARKTGDLAEALIPGDAFRSRVWIEDQCSRWSVLAEIPAYLICGSSDALAGSVWRYSFSRYDYTRGEHEPAISSSSPHAEANFHRQEEWGQLEFKR
ncbi:MAG: hypothetical protein RLY20_943 [Verrucomicrobiota bacterium]|jgi:hypothetical protein